MPDVTLEIGTACLGLETRRDVAMGKKVFASSIRIFRAYAFDDCSMLARAFFAVILIGFALPAIGEDAPLREGRSVARQDWTDRVDQSRQSSARFVGLAVDAFLARRQAATAMIPSRDASVVLNPNYLDDLTLRYGDVIAQESRLLLFRGSPGLRRHQPSDFTELTQTPTLGGAHDAELRAINNVLARERR